MTLVNRYNDLKHFLFPGMRSAAHWHIYKFIDDIKKLRIPFSLNQVIFSSA